MSISSRDLETFKKVWELVEGGSGGERIAAIEKAFSISKRADLRLSDLISMSFGSNNLERQLDYLRTEVSKKNREIYDLKEELNKLNRKKIKIPNKILNILRVISNILRAISNIFSHFIFGYKDIYRPFGNVLSSIRNYQNVNGIIFIKNIILMPIYFIVFVVRASWYTIKFVLGVTWMVVLTILMFIFVLFFIYIIFYILAAIFKSIT